MRKPPSPLISRGSEGTSQELAPSSKPGEVSKGCPGVKGPIPQPVLMSALTLHVRARAVKWRNRRIVFVLHVFLERPI